MYYSDSRPLDLDILFTKQSPTSTALKGNHIKSTIQGYSHIKPGTSVKSMCHSGVKSYVAMYIVDNWLKSDRECHLLTYSEVITFIIMTS